MYLKGLFLHGLLTNHQSDMTYLHTTSQTWPTYKHTLCLTYLSCIPWNSLLLLLCPRRLHTQSWGRCLLDTRLSGGNKTRVLSNIAWKTFWLHFILTFYFWVLRENLSSKQWMFLMNLYYTISIVISTVYKFIAKYQT